MKIQTIGLYGVILGFLLYIFFVFLNIETTGAVAILFHSLGLQLGALAVNNGGV